MKPLIRPINVKVLKKIQSNHHNYLAIINQEKLLSLIFQPDRINIRKMPKIYTRSTKLLFQRDLTIQISLEVLQT